MQGNDILQIAEDRGIVIQGNFPSNDGVAVLGPLSESERKGLQLQVSTTLAAEISYRYPANIVKNKDHKSVDVDCTVFVFSPSQLVQFVGEVFKAVKAEGA